MAILITLFLVFSVLISVFAFLYGIFRYSWSAILVSGITVLPISFYALSGEPPVAYFGLIPVIHIILTVLFTKRKEIGG